MERVSRLQGALQKQLVIGTAVHAKAEGNADSGDLEEEQEIDHSTVYDPIGWISLSKVSVPPSDTHITCTDSFIRFCSVTLPEHPFAELERREGSKRGQSERGREAQSF